MGNFAQYLFANSYSGLYPVMNTETSGCVINGQAVDCGPIGGMFLAGLGLLLLVCLVVIIIMIVSSWKIYKKAGQKGWASIVPVYNMVVMLHIVKKPIWWIFLLFIPYVNIVFGIIVSYNLAKAFGKGGWFTVGLVLLPFIFYPILAFGKSTYMMPTVPFEQSMGVPPTNPQTM